MNLALQLDDPAPAIRKVNELEERRHALTEEISRLEEEDAVCNALGSVTREDVARLVRTLAVEIDDAERHRLEGVLQAAVEQITLDAANLHCLIHYRIATDRTLDMASPRRRAVWGALRKISATLKICASTLGRQDSSPRPTD